MAQCASLIAPYTPKGMPAGQFKREIGVNAALCRRLDFNQTEGRT
jgi:hypothetical protein